MVNLNAIKNNLQFKMKNDEDNNNNLYRLKRPNSCNAFTYYYSDNNEYKKVNEQNQYPTCCSMYIDAVSAANQEINDRRIIIN